MTSDIEMTASIGLDIYDYNKITDDWKLVDNGNTIPSKTYSRQSYKIK